MVKGPRRRRCAPPFIPNVVALALFIGQRIICWSQKWRFVLLLPQVFGIFVCISWQRPAPPKKEQRWFWKLYSWFTIQYYIRTHFVYLAPYLLFKNVSKATDSCLDSCLGNRLLPWIQFLPQLLPSDKIINNVESFWEFIGMDLFLKVLTRNVMCKNVLL